MLNENFTWEYDEFSRHYIVRNARLFFVNFAGAAQDYNQEGRRNFRLEVSEDLAKAMEEQGVYVRTREATSDSEETQHLLKVSVYPDADIRLLSGKAMSSAVIDNENKSRDMGKMVDDEFRKGHVMNGNIDLEFHISKNTRVPSSSPYLRVDMLVLPIRRSKLAESYAMYEDDDDLPM